jgi:ABC-type uncharacterized transport system substrate-binding protein
VGHEGVACVAALAAVRSCGVAAAIVAETFVDLAIPIVVAAVTDLVHARRIGSAAIDHE